MAATSIVGRLVYLITGDSKMLNNSLASTQAAVAKFSKFVMSAIGIGGAVQAFRMLIRVGEDMVRAAAEEIKSESALAAAIRVTGGNVDEMLPRYKAFAQSIHAVTLSTHEEVEGLQRQALNFGITTSKMDEAVRGAIGLNRAFGIDMNTALRGIANAYEGNYAALSRYIPAIRNASTEAEKHAILQKAMADGFALAKAEAESDAAAMIQFKKSMEELKAEGGKMLLEFLAPSIRSLTEFVIKVTAAIAESQHLKQVAKDLAAGKKVDAVDELKLMGQRLNDLKAQRQSQIDLYGSATEGIEQEINALQAHVNALSEVARYEGIIADGKRQGNAAAVAAAEAELKRQQELATWIKMVTDEYGKTEQGQREILEAQIAKWEYELTQSKNYRPEIQAILDMLYKQRDANLQIASSDNAMADRWMQAGVVLGALRDQEAIEEAEREQNLADYAEKAKIIWDQGAREQEAYNAELDRQAKESAANRLSIEEKLAKDKKLLQDTAINDFVAIWGALRSLNDQKTQYDLDMLKRKQKAELAAFTGTEEEKKKLEESFEKERAMLEYKGALRSWQLQVAGAFAALARSILEAAKNTWPIPAIPMMALAGIMGGIEIAAIMKAKPVPAFAGGGEFDVPAGYPNDSFPMYAETGEHVTIEPAGASEQPVISAPIIIQIDATPIYRGLLQASKKGVALLNERGLVR